MQHANLDIHYFPTRSKNAGVEPTACSPEWQPSFADGGRKSQPRSPQHPSHCAHLYRRPPIRLRRCPLRRRRHRLQPHRRCFGCLSRRPHLERLAGPLCSCVRKAARPASPSRSPWPRNFGARLAGSATKGENGKYRNLSAASSQSIDVRTAGSIGGLIFRRIN